MLLAWLLVATLTRVFFIFLVTEPQESTVIHFLRAGILLAALVAVPGLAVCWNCLPDGLFSVEQAELSRELSAVTQYGSSSGNHVADELVADEFAANTESMTDFREPALLSSTQDTSSQSTDIVPMSAPPIEASETGTQNQQIADSFTHEPAVWPTASVAEPAAELVTVPASGVAAVPQHDSKLDYSKLESRLRELGARYYRLEKWGSQSELFRFSCYVTATGPSPYQKHFQSIDSEELRVMENVIREIERWKTDGTRL